MVVGERDGVYGRIWEISVFFQAEDGIRDSPVTGVQTCALPISPKQQLELTLVVFDEAEIGR